MGYEKFLELVKEEFYTEPWGVKRILRKDIPKVAFERYLGSGEVVDTIRMGYRDSVEEWEENKEKFTQKGATREKNARMDAHKTAHVLSLMIEAESYITRPLAFFRP